MRCYIIDSVIGEFTGKENTYVLPVLIQIDENSYEDDQNFKSEIVAEALKNKRKMTTSQPNIGKTLELFEKLKETYTEFVLIHTGSKLSGTFNTSVSAAEETGLNYIAIDSKGVGPHIELLLEEAHRNEALSLKEIEQFLTDKARNAGAIIIPGSLERLKMSGRINAVQMFVSDLFKIIPIFLLEDGELKVFKKERTQKKAMETMVQYVENNENAINISILEYNFENVSFFKNRLNKGDTRNLHTALLVHLGDGSIGLLWN